MRPRTEEREEKTIRLIGQSCSRLAELPNRLPVASIPQQGKRIAGKPPNAKIELFSVGPGPFAYGYLRAHHFSEKCSNMINYLVQQKLQRAPVV